jgi:hypothetical protein
MTNKYHITLISFAILFSDVAPFITVPDFAYIATGLLVLATVIYSAVTE